MRTILVRTMLAKCLTALVDELQVIALAIVDSARVHSHAESVDCNCEELRVTEGRRNKTHSCQYRKSTCGRQSGR